MEIRRKLQLLAEFNNLPHSSSEITFLEICRYPKRRFEEICSRILSFYFCPLKEHKLNDLFLSSLLELLHKDDFKYSKDQIRIINEDNADGKRIDILISTSDFVIGIENKITAALYNPLEVYKNRIEEYNKNNVIKIVLSLDRITKKHEVDLINDNGFISITYSEFFEVVKRNVGRYITNCNQKYLTQLFDFIQTIENMKTFDTTDKRLFEFFCDKSSEIDELIGSYNNHIKLILQTQIEAISVLREKIGLLTGVEWWAWQGWDLGYDRFNKSRPRIGIEASYKLINYDPLGEFRIYITAWKLNDWQPYEKFLVEKFPDRFLDKVDNRAYLHMDVIPGGDEELILVRLKEYYDLLLEITK